MQMKLTFQTGSMGVVFLDMGVLRLSILLRDAVCVKTRSLGKVDTLLTKFIHI